jgi:DNA-binding response OmpR family regulator
LGKRILAVDDDPSVREMVRDYLVDNDFEVVTAADGIEMKRILAEQAVDLVILDVKLPGQDGFGLARALRSRSHTPIIMLTAQDEEVDRIVGLELGADDYLTKPFSPRELLARIRAVLRRQDLATEAAGLAVRGEAHTYRFAGWELQTATHRLISPRKQEVELTPGEYSLLLAFLRSPRRILSRDQLIEDGRARPESFDRAIDVQILRLRRKIEVNPNEPALIKTERSAGYFFDAEVTALR